MDCGSFAGSGTHRNLLSNCSFTFYIYDICRGVVFLSHGLAEHTGRYEHVAKAYNDEGYTVMGIDHQGIVIYMLYLMYILLIILIILQDMVVARETAFT